MALTTITNARATFTVDGDSYEAQLKNVTVTTDSSGGGTGDKTLSGETIPDPLTFVDRLTGTYVQDWTAPAGGLVGFSREHRGEVVDVELESVPAAYKLVGTIQLTPLDVTLDPNAPAESSIDWQLITADETWPAAAPAPLEADED